MENKMKSKIVKETTKIYTIKKGIDDFRVWTRATDFLSEYMMKKRDSRFKNVKTKRDIKVCITILEIAKARTRL